MIRRGEGYDYKYGKCTGERTDQADEEKPRPGGCGRVYRGGTAHGGRADGRPVMAGTDRTGLPVRELCRKAYRRSR